jgi:hypothetical protein
MIRRYAFISSLAATLLVAEAVAAQTCTLKYVDGSDVDIDNKDINYYQCAILNSTLTFEVKATAGAKYEIFTGSQCGTGGLNDTDCKTGSTNFTIGGDGTETYDFKVQDLLAADGDTCDAGNYSVKAYFVPAGTSAKTDTTTVASTGQILCQKDIDTNPPPRPTKPKGGSGENEIKVKWSFDSEDEDLEKFWIYYEVCPGSSGLCNYLPKDCGSSAAAATTGVALDDAGTPNYAELFSDLQYTSVSNGVRQVSLKNVVEIDERAAVIVVAQDNAGNLSYPSDVTCIQGVATRGFCDMKAGSKKLCKNGCSVNAVGANSSHGLSSIAAIFITLFLISARRRTV